MSEKLETYIQMRERHLAECRQMEERGPVPDTSRLRIKNVGPVEMAENLLDWNLNCCHETCESCRNNLLMIQRLLKTAQSEQKANVSRERAATPAPAVKTQVPNAIVDKIIFTAAGKRWVAQVIQQGDDVPAFGSQVEDFAGLDVTNAEAKKLTEPAPVAPASGAITVNAATGPNGPFDLPAAPAPVGEPWLYAIEGPNGEWKDGETCVFGDRASAQDEVDLLNDDGREKGYKVVPLYRAATPAPCGKEFRP